jgi:hypothetical protein
MFKQGSIADEICSSMEKELVSHQVEKQHGFSKVAKAADLLNAAATLFAEAGMSEEAEEITDVLERLANRLEKT